MSDPAVCIRIGDDRIYTTGQVLSEGAPLFSSRVLFMLFDRFLLAVESRDLSQADKILIRVSSFPKLSDG